MGCHPSRLKRINQKSPEKARKMVENAKNGHVVNAILVGKYQQDGENNESYLVYHDKQFSTKYSNLAPKERHKGSVKWCRPFQICDNPKLFVDGISKSDIAQGNLGDCWFLFSCAAIAQRPKLMKKVIPTILPLHGAGYTGMGHFRFFQFGTWVDVIIDDRIPVDSQTNCPVYARGIDDSEFWVVLLEKAYAKIHGSYAAIEGGQSMDALVDLTGGLVERYELAHLTGENDFYQNMLRAHQSEATFITCSKKIDSHTQHESLSHMGLIAGHAYTVTDITAINFSDVTEKLIRLRNPWANGTEWKGAWNDSDNRWNLLDEDTKHRLQYCNESDG